jgi:hypothetical protein
MLAHEPYGPNFVFLDLIFADIGISNGDCLMAEEKTEKEWTEEDWTKRISPVDIWLNENADSTVELIEDTIEEVQHQVNIGNKKPHRRVLAWAQILLSFRLIDDSPVGHNAKVYPDDVQEWFDEVHADTMTAFQGIDDHQVIKLTHFRTQTIDGVKLRFRKASVQESLADSKLKMVQNLYDDGLITADWTSLAGFSQELQGASDD